jgi:hypothetical protein
LPLSLCYIETFHSRRALKGRKRRKFSPVLISCGKSSYIMDANSLTLPRS